MSKTCIKCNKSVYPLEELKCLDKIWHKTCFKCWDCGMSLNIKNYKGFDKKPYCSAHYPQIKATMVSDTPELQRVAQNTKLQSQVKYHEDFEKNIKGSKIEVSDDPEVLRVSKVNHLVSQLEYKDKDKAAAAARLEERRQSLTQPTTGIRTSGGAQKWAPSGSVSSNGDDVEKPSPYSSRTVATSTLYTSAGKVEGTPRVKRVGSIADYDPVNDNYGSLTQGYRPSSTSSQSQSQTWEETVPVSPMVVPTSPTRSTGSSVASTSGVVTASEHEQSDQDLDHQTTPGDEVFGEGQRSRSTNGNEEHAHAVRDTAKNDDAGESRGSGREENEEGTSDEGVVEEMGQMSVVEAESSPVHAAGRTEDEGSPVHAAAEKISSSVHETAVSQAHIEEQGEETVVEHTQQEFKQEVDEDDEPGTSISGAVFSALYDYEAGDDDEVGFSEGDEVVDVRSVDDGWMYGTVSRTGQRGLFPSNYVQQVA